jgi:acetate---CoA ligase (ADP-forming)
MTDHALTPLLAPHSIAVVGASPRPDTPGHDVLRMLARGGFTGRLYPVNPRYDSIEGMPCFSSLRHLPETVDLTIMSIANARLEDAMSEAAAMQVRSAVIFASGYLDQDESPRLTERLTAIARAAGMSLCGGNCMGYYNEMAHVWACGFPSPRQPRCGGITLISHAGSVFGVLAHNDPRLHFNLLVSSGQELVTTAADYLDYALEQPQTHVIGLFLETIRDPARFTAALAKAAMRRVPVVALKVGRTEASAALAVSHSGAMAGNDAAYEALFDRAGVIRVHDLDEMACTLLLLQGGRRASAGGLAAIHDSGGEREMVVDLAHDAKVPFARIGEQTVAVLRATLDYGLDPVNPLDAWGTGEEFVASFSTCFRALVNDPDAALGVFFNDLRDGSYLSQGFAAVCREVHGQTTKPVVLITNYSQVRHDRVACELVDADVPVLDGTVAGLKAIRHLLDYRDFERRPEDPPPTLNIDPAAGHRLARGGALDEVDAWSLLRDYGIATPAHALVSSADAAVAAAQRVGLPVALKTAMPGILHKTEVSGVRLNLATSAAVRAAYHTMAERLGPSVLVSAMVPSGIELALGVLPDPQFGPVVMLAAGGVLIEMLQDARYALAPFGAATARRMLEGLRVHSLLSGRRGAAPVDFDALAATIARFSVLAWDLRGLVSEIDVNPIIVGAQGTTAVDALIVMK